MRALPNTRVRSAFLLDQRCALEDAVGSGAAIAEMNEGFETDERRAAIHTELRAWVCELAGKGGVAKIRKWMLQDREIAAVICHSQPFLLGLAGDVRETMVESCVKKWKPEADAKLNKAIDLKKIAARYSGFVRGPGAASFNKSIAANGAAGSKRDAHGDARASQPTVGIPAALLRPLTPIACRKR